jgi:iron complex transport system substrate-binding protein
VLHRRLLLGSVVLAVAAATAACAGSDPGAAAGFAEAASTRTVAHEFGVTEVPGEPRRVIALDESAALSALAVGIRPAAVFAAWGSEIGQSVLRAEGVEIIPMPVGDPPGTETVLAQRPDLVLFTSVGDPSTFGRLGPAVPTVALPSSTRPWRETLAALGSIFDRAAEASRLERALAARIAELAPPEGVRSVTVFMSYGGTLAMAAPDSPAALLLAEAGFRPTPPPGGTAAVAGQPYATLSAELLPEIDSDVVAVFGGAVYDEAAVTGLPTFAALPAARAGRAVTVLGEGWQAGDPFSTYWILADLGALAGGAGSGIGTVTDAPARFAEFRAMLR